MNGQADAAGIPDTLRLDISVVATASSVSEALAKANESAGAVQQSLLGNRVAKKDLQTSGLSISPSYDDAQRGTPRLKGYQVSETLSAELRDLVPAGDAIGKAVDAGGDAVRINGIRLDLEVRADSRRSRAHALVRWQRPWHDVGQRSPTPPIDISRELDGVGSAILNP